MVFGVVTEVLIWLAFTFLGFSAGYLRCHLETRNALLGGFRLLRASGRSERYLLGYWRAYLDTAWRARKR